MSSPTPILQMLLRRLTQVRHMLTLLLVVFLFINFYIFSTGQADQPPPQLFFTQQFERAAGLGHKFAELLMGWQYAQENNLTYIFDEESFLENSHDADLTFFADRLKDRLETLANHGLRYPPKRWAAVTEFTKTTADLLDKHWSIRRIPGVYASPGTHCEYQGWGESFCFERGLSYYNANREFQDLLKSPFRRKTDAQRVYRLEDRVTIHLRLGDIQNMLVPGTYAQILRNFERMHHISIQPEQLHFVYYLAESSNHREDDSSALQTLKEMFPKAQYHNLEKIEDTIWFLAQSATLITSGSGMSYMAAYLCSECRVVFVEPKEYEWSGMAFNESTYDKNFYYMKEWVPHFRYLD
ncbi:hypothetical protein MVEG_02710 [Podila verticillata NRRL 6337]|nr:hypothetical protein MVEG_02710 [Podila verticillata NRRL 6337]